MTKNPPVPPTRVSSLFDANRFKKFPNLEAQLKDALAKLNDIEKKLEICISIVEKRSSRTEIISVGIQVGYIIFTIT